MSSNHSAGPVVSKGLLCSLLVVFFTITAVWLWIGKCCSPNPHHEESETKTEMKAEH